MATNWTVLTGRSMAQVLALGVIKAANQNTGPESQDTDPYTDDEENRRDDLVTGTVAAFRGCVRACGRQPLSVTAGAVPPEAVLHVLNSAAYALLMSTPNLPLVVLDNLKGWDKKNDAAEKYFEAVRRGETVTEPTDPTGQDYATAVSADNPAVKSVVWGDLNATDDEYAAGYKTLSSGGTVTLPVDDMTTT